MEKLKYSILMLDDHPESLSFILAQLSDIPYLEEPVVVSDVHVAFDLLRESEFDILFLDMDLGHPEIDGIKFMSMLSNPPVTVALSSFSEYVYKTADVGIKRFCGKLISIRTITELMEELVEEVDRKERKRARSIKTLEIKDVSGHEVQIKIDDIYYGEIDNNTLTLYMEEGTVILRSTMKAFLEKLPPQRFAKPHNSYFVSLEKIIMVHKKTIHFAGSRSNESLNITQEAMAEFKHKYQIFKQNHSRRGE